MERKECGREGVEAHSHVQERSGFMVNINHGHAQSNDNSMQNKNIDKPSRLLLFELIENRHSPFKKQCNFGYPMMSFNKQYLQTQGLQREWYLEMVQN